jgi:hypothetical protein
MSPYLHREALPRETPQSFLPIRIATTLPVRFDPEGDNPFPSVPGSCKRYHHALPGLSIS